MKEVAQFLGIETTEVLELGLNRVFGEVNETVSSMLSGGDEIG